MIKRVVDWTDDEIFTYIDGLENLSINKNDNYVKEIIIDKYIIVVEINKDCLPNFQSKYFRLQTSVYVRMFYYESNGKRYSFRPLEKELYKEKNWASLFKNNIFYTSAAIINISHFCDIIRCLAQYTNLESFV